MGHMNEEFLDDVFRDFRREPYVNLLSINPPNLPDNRENIKTVNPFYQPRINSEIKGHLILILDRK